MKRTSKTVKALVAYLTTDASMYDCCNRFGAKQSNVSTYSNSHAGGTELRELHRRDFRDALSRGTVDGYDPDCSDQLKKVLVEELEEQIAQQRAGKLVAEQPNTVLRDLNEIASWVLIGDFEGKAIALCNLQSMLSRHAPRDWPSTEQIVKSLNGEYQQ